MENYGKVVVLCHHGTKGMKWGQRLYQHRDGSLTALGRVRYHTNGDFKVKVNRQRALKKARDAKAAKKKAEEEAKIAAEKRAKDLAAGKIPVKKMTDAELAAKMLRAENEKRYKDAYLATHTGKRVASKLFNEALIPGIIDGGRKLVGNTVLKYGSDALGLNEKGKKSAYEKMKEEHDMSNWKRKMTENADWHKRRAEKQQEEAEERASKNKKEDKAERVTAEVIGEGTSSRSRNANDTNRKPSDYYDPIDTVGRWVDDTPSSNLPAVYTGTGRSAVAGYLKYNDRKLLNG